MPAARALLATSLLFTCSARLAHAPVSSVSSQAPTPRLASARGVRHQARTHPTARAAFSSGSSAMPLSYPRPTVVDAKSGTPTAAVFLMHGLGDTAAGWEDVAYQLRSALPHVKFILPTAPVRPITLNGGFPMPGWYDIASLDSLQGRADGAGVSASADYLAGLLESTTAGDGIPPHRVVMAGFSQGGAMALAMLGRVQSRLGGVISMSGYLPLATAAAPPPLTSPANAATPVLFCHGDADEVVRFEFGHASADALKAAGVPVTFKTYRGMGHSACPAELSDVADFLAEVLPA